MMSPELSGYTAYDRSVEVPSLSSAGDAFLALELDRLLQPLRRVLAYALRDLEAHTPHLRYVEATAGRWLNAASQLELPEAVREWLAPMLACMQGFDAAPLEERQARLRSMYQDLARIDALYGFPLPARVRVPTPEKPREMEEFLEEGAPVPRAPVESPEVEDAEGAMERRFRLGDSASTGRPVTSLGVTEEEASLLADEGVETLADLLLLAPVGEEVVRPVHGAGLEIPRGRVAVGGRIHQRVTLLGSAGRRVRAVLLGAGPLRVEWDAPFASSAYGLTTGEKVVLVGELEVDASGSAMLRNPEVAASTGHAVHLQAYGLEGLSDRSVRRWLSAALPELDKLRDTASSEQLATLRLPSLADAIRDVHLYGSARPDARRRLAFDEALLLQLGLATPRFQSGRERGIAHAILHGLSTRIGQMLEIQFDDSQQSALEDIKRDLRQGVPMVRLLTGQAGMSKMGVALLAAVAVADSKSQVVFLAPDATSAELRFLFLESVLREVGLVARLLTAEPTRSQRDAVRRGEVHVVFGTPEMLDHDIEFRRLGLIVAEERETFGRVSSKVAALRAPRPDLLLVAATPVPAAALLSTYADHDVSVVEKSPRWKVKSTVLPESQRAEAYRRVAEQFPSGRQAWIVFPMAPPRAGGDAAEGSTQDVLDLRSARAVVHTLQTEIFPGRSVGLFHGGMSREERARAYEDFRHRRYDVMVATTPVEDGPPVGAATMMIVEQADRMSLVRLQRLRGHVACLQTEGECFFLTGQEPDEAGLARLELLERETDDWVVAEWDAQVRGLESLISRDGQGGARLRWLDPVRDRDLLVWGRDQAHAILEEDPTLRRGAHGDIARALRDRWDDLMAAPCPVPEPGGGAPSRKRRRRRKRK
jgi:ATP-dependent DNA helicase RecG